MGGGRHFIESNQWFKRNLILTCVVLCQAKMRTVKNIMKGRKKMKIKTKLLTAAAGICACAAMTSAVSAYLDIGDLNSYYVSADNSKDDNRSKSFAWALQQTSLMKYDYNIAGGGTVNVTLKKWDSNNSMNDTIVGKWDYQTESKSYNLNSFNSGNYYAEIKLMRGNSAYGYTRLSKR